MRPKLITLSVLQTVIIRYAGPRGGPGMAEMLRWVSGQISSLRGDLTNRRACCFSPTAALMGAGLGSTVSLVTDGRFSGKQSHLLIDSCPHH